METQDDVQLIRAVLAGDDSAFGTLVEKYQKSVHAFAWRKIGDFHLCRRNYTRYLPPRISKPFNVEKSEPVSQVVVCHCESALSELAAQRKKT